MILSIIGSMVVRVVSMDSKENYPNGKQNHK